MPQKDWEDFSWQERKEYRKFFGINMYETYWYQSCSHRGTRAWRKEVKTERRYIKRWYKSSRYEKLNGIKSTARMYVRRLAYAQTDKDFEEIEARLYEASNSHQETGWFD